MDHGDALLTVRMGMRVLVGGASVGSPAGVSQANGTIGVFSSALQAADFAHGLAQLDITMGINYGDTGAVIAPVLKPP